MKPKLFAVLHMYAKIGSLNHIMVGQHWAIITILYKYMQFVLYSLGRMFVGENGQQCIF